MAATETYKMAYTDTYNPRWLMAATETYKMAATETFKISATNTYNPRWLPQILTIQDGCPAGSRE